MSIIVLMLSGLIYYNATVSAVQVDRYWSVLEGDHMKPPTDTDAHGFIGLKFTEDFKKIVFNVNVNDINNITGIYLYSRGDNTKNATLVLDFLEEAKEVKAKDKYKEASMLLSSKHEVEGTVTVGGATSDDLRGELKGKSLEDLHKLVLNERLFVMVETKDFPRGEIGAAEFVSIERYFPDISDFDWD